VGHTNFARNAVLTLSVAVDTGFHFFFPTKVLSNLPNDSPIFL
jgi:hypothetical protein